MFLSRVNSAGGLCVPIHTQHCCSWGGVHGIHLLEGTGLGQF